MGIYVLITFCIVVGAAVLLLLQVFLSTRQSLLPGLVLPLFALLLWAVLKFGVIDMEKVVTLSESGHGLVLLILLLCFFCCAAVLALSRWLRQRNSLIREDLRERKLQFKQELRRREQEKKEKQQ